MLREVVVCLGVGSRTASRCRSYLGTVIVFVLASCLSHQESPDAVYQRIWSTYLSGNLREAAQDASAQSEKFKNAGSRAWFWQFRLLDAEALIAQAQVPEAMALITDGI